MKKIMMLICCIAIVLGTMVFTKDSTILAANIRDTFTEGDLTYEVTGLGTPTTNGEVKIKDYDETSSTTALTIPETVTFDSKEYDVIGVMNAPFDNASKVKTLKLSKKFVDMEASGSDFIARNKTNFKNESSLETIIVDENNPVLKVIDGVLYNMTSGSEFPVLYPFDSSKTEFVLPEFIKNSSDGLAFDRMGMLLSFAFNLENIEFTLEGQGIFTKNGILYEWINRDDHSKGARVVLIPRGMKRVVLTDAMDMQDGEYYLRNNAMEFVVEGNSEYKSIDGCLYEGNTLVFYPGGRSEAVYKIPEGTEKIGSSSPAFCANQSLKSLIIPSSVRDIFKFGLYSDNLKSVKIEGDVNNITWIAENFQDLGRVNIFKHIYVDNGNTASKTAMQATFSHLTDEYFHELGAVPTTNITNVKTSIENTKDIKVSWTASNANVNYEVRRYNADGTYKVVGSTTDASFIDTTTEYNTTYQYEVVPYSLPVTSSNIEEDAFREYHTYGTASNKESVTTPIQKYKGTYTYKLADGTQGSITKDVKKGESVVNNAPALPEIKGYVFDKWTSDLLNMEVVDKDFTATAIYKEVDAPVDNDKPDNNKPDNNKPDNNNPDNNNPDISKPSNDEKTDIGKPSNDEKTPSDTKDTVKTGDQTSIAMSLILMIITGTILTVVTRKKDNKI